jgi:hypothetical protein
MGERLISCAIGTPFPKAMTEKGNGKRRTLFVPGIVISVSALTAFLCEVSTKSFPGDSDGATVVLEGQAMSAGHLTLHGWALAADSFWSVDALFYTVGVGLVGIRPLLLHLVPAFITSLIVLFGILVARENRKGVAAVAAAVTVFALLGLPGRFLSYFLLRGPLHVGTTLWCLVAFFALRKARFGPGWMTATVFLAAGIVGDLQTVALGVVPIFLAGVFAMMRGRRIADGVPTVAAAVASVVLAVVVRKLAELVGTFSVGKLQPYASHAQMLRNLKNIGSGAVHMFGIESGPLSAGGVPSVLQGVHVVGLAVVILAVLVAIWRLCAGFLHGDRDGHIYSGNGRSQKSDSLIDDLLLAACVGSVVVFVGLSNTNAFEFDRYLTSLVIFSSILAARMVGHVAVSTDSLLVKRVSAALGVLVLAAFAAGTTLGVTGSVTPPPQFSGVVSFLEQKHLDAGIGDYLDASIITVATDGKVTVRPVTGNRAQKVVRYQRQSSAAWYAGQSFGFLLYDVATPGSFNSETATATFGPPASTYQMGSYRVLVWSHPISVSAEGYDPG